MDWLLHFSAFVWLVVTMSLRAMIISVTILVVWF